MEYSSQGFHTEAPLCETRSVPSQVEDVGTINLERFLFGIKELKTFEFFLNF